MHSKEIKLFVNWMNKIAHKFSVVKGEYGGKRFIIFNDINEVSVENIIRKAVDIFFPNGKSKIGKRIVLKSEFNFSLQSFNEEIITEFYDKNHVKCSFEEYIRNSGRFLSQITFHLISIEKTPDSESEESVKSVYMDSIEEIPIYSVEKDSELRGSETDLIHSSKSNISTNEKYNISYDFIFYSYY